MNQTTTLHLCPVDGCDFTTPAPDPFVFAGFAPDGHLVFDLDRASLAKVEANLAEHAATHTPIEYLTTISRLHGELTVLRRMFANTPEVSRDDHD